MGGIFLRTIGVAALVGLILFVMSRRSISVEGKYMFLGSGNQPVALKFVLDEQVLDINEKDLTVTTEDDGSHYRLKGVYFMWARPKTVKVRFEVTGEAPIDSAVVPLVNDTEVPPMTLQVGRHL